MKDVYLCPFCDEIGHRIISEKIVRNDRQKWTKWQCDKGHIFYCYEKVCKDQQWGEMKYHNENVRAGAKRWENQLKALKKDK